MIARHLETAGIHAQDSQSDTGKYLSLELENNRIKNRKLSGSFPTVERITKELYSRGKKGNLLLFFKNIP